MTILMETKIARPQGARMGAACERFGMTILQESKIARLQGARMGAAHGGAA